VPTYQRLYGPSVLILAILLFGMLVGAAAQLILRHGSRIDWSMAVATGLLGSFVGGLLGSLLAGDGLELHPSGLVGSLVGALILTAFWMWMRARGRAGTPHSRSGNPAVRAKDRRE
jgi:uncharacterized membrane protein YeaQ/YmgE (transglycosylase-associated protein family)